MFKPTLPCSRRAGRGAIALVLAATLPSACGLPALSTVPLPTYSRGSGPDIKPNIMFVLDDSGSMDWDYMPDWANDVPPNYYALPIFFSRNAAFNGVAYNPAITYSAPYKFNADGTRDTTTYPSMNGMSATAGADTGQTLPNWRNVPDDGYSVQNRYWTGSAWAYSHSDLTSNAYFWTIIPGEYCDSPIMTSCTATTTATGNYQYPASLRWCSDTNLSTCRATQNTTYSYPRIAWPAVASISFSSSSSASVTSILVDGKEILSAATSASSTSSTVASRVAAAINSCTGGATGSCTTSGFYAYRPSGSATVTIVAPSTTTATPVLSITGTTTTTVGAFARGGQPAGNFLSGTASTSAAPGQNVATVITSTVDSYPYPGTAAKASSRTDCAGTTCTYQEEMTNYANWWAYYRTRMQMMKTSTSIAFSSLDSATDIAAGNSRFRVGFLTLNNNTGSDFVNITDFDSTQKVTWYSKLFSANPSNSTPLREALAIAGRLNGGKYNGTSFRGSTVTDPLQYSCQKNFTILSTDGYWNGNAGVKLDGSSSIGNQDASLPRPYNDGATVTINHRTSLLQQRSTIRTAEKGTLQSRTSQLQTQTRAVQERTTGLQQRNDPVEERTSTLEFRRMKVQVKWQKETRTRANSSSPWGPWTLWTDLSNDCSPGTNRECQLVASPVWQDVGSCRDRGAGRQGQDEDEGWASATGSCSVGSASSPTLNPYTAECRYTAWSSWSDSPGTSCTWRSQNNSNLTARECRYNTSGTFVDIALPGSCTVVAQNTGTSSGTTWNDARSCQYGAAGAWSANIASCTVDSQDTGTTRSPAKECRYDPAGFTTLVDATSTCTAVAQATSTANGTVYNTARNCTYTAWTSWADAGSCTVAAQSTGPTTYSRLLATDCQYRWDAAEQHATCPTPTFTSGNYSNVTVYRSCTDTVGSWVNVTTPATCTSTAGAFPGGERIECQYSAWSGWSSTASCTAAAQSTASPYTVNTARECQTLTSGGTSDTLADVAAYYYQTDLRTSSPASTADKTGPSSATDGGCTGPTIAPSTTANNLCTDNVPVSGRDTNTKQHMVTHTLGLGMQGRMIYSNYQNNLTGQRSYVPDYWNHQSGDFHAVANGTVADGSSLCSWQSSGSCNWPTPSADSQANIDDLWHAAVNGRGTYFSAGDPQTLAESLRSVLSEIIRTPRPGTAAAAATSNPNITSTDNFVFSSSYLSLDWYGELIMQRIGTSGTLGSQQWSAMQLLQCRPTPWTSGKSYVIGDDFKSGTDCYVVTTAYTSGASFGGDDTSNTRQFSGTLTARQIYTASSGARIPFEWSSLDATQKTYFPEPWISYVSSAHGLSQFCTSGASCLSATAKTAAAGQALVEFLAGTRTNEGSYFRSRTRVLGDIVSSEARYVKAPLQGYTDANYQTFKSEKSSRDGIVYVGANDGMLHAFDALTGVERWAFIPPSVLPNLYKLADTNYSSKHQFFVDGSPEVGDICPNTPTGSPAAAVCTKDEWKTILVGGLNLGGKAYYALDITDPGNPIFLWEFTNANLGYSYSNPRITKLKDGTWVVIVASGYQTSDGRGRLFVLNANTGALIRTIDTGVGDTTNEAGLARISARAPNASTDNTVDAVYGGDLLGNVWRFDVNDDIATSGYDAHRLATLKDASNAVQPITARPTVSSINGTPVVIVTTGQYLGINDLATTQVQSVYALKDKRDSDALPEPRATNSQFVRQTIVETTCPDGTAVTICSPGQSVRTTVTQPVDWGVRNGWYFDMPATGERGVTDSTLARGTLAFTTLVPQTSSGGTVSCTTDSSPSARGFLYTLDYTTGGSVAGANGVIGEFIGDGVPTRVSIFRNTDGTIRGITRMSGTASSATDPNSTDLAGSREDSIPTGGSSSTTPTRRSWRILNGD